jgi:hypothetical protein
VTLLDDDTEVEELPADEPPPKKLRRDERLEPPLPLPPLPDELRVVQVVLVGTAGAAIPGEGGGTGWQLSRGISV